jgi:protein ImuA
MWYIYCPLCVIHLIRMKVAAPEIIEALQKQILDLQGIRTRADEHAALGLGEMESAFPGKTFPRAAIHELISSSSEEASSTNAFIALVLGKLITQSSSCVWISTKSKIFPPALKSFGIEPERVLFVNAWKLKDALWTIEEALKCDALCAVVGEISELSFNDSRRLQLAVEKSKVTAFIHRHKPKTITAVACVTRWRISPIASAFPYELPGVGFPRWEVELLKVRNGRPGKWLVQWSPQGLEYIPQKITAPEIHERQTA